VGSSPAPEAVVGGERPAPKATPEVAARDRSPAPEVMVSEVTAGDKSPAPKVVPDAVKDAAASSLAHETTASGPASSCSLAVGTTSSGPHAAAATDTAVEEPAMVLGHPILRAPSDVSLDEAMGTARWVLSQARDVLC
jgi:hypothetical protein